MKEYLLNKEEKRIFFKLKLKSKLDRSFLVAVRRYLRDIGINEKTYTDDDVIYALVMGKDKEKCLM